MTLDERVEHTHRAFRRALDRARLYGVSHPEAATAVDEVWSHLSALVRDRGAVSFTSGVDGLRWQGRVVVPEDDDKEGLGRLLHREGIHSLSFHPSLRRTELDRLLDVLRLNLALPEHEEETMESLLWQARLDGVTFKAVAALMEAEAISGDALRYLQDSGQSSVRALVEGLDVDALDLADPTHGTAALSDDELVRAVARAGEEAGTVAGEDGAWEVASDGWEREFTAELEQDREAVDRMRGEVAREQPGDQVRRASELLFRVARARRKELRPGAALELADGALAEIMRQRDVFALAAVLDTAAAQRDAAEDPAVRRRLERFVDAGSHPTTVARLLAEAGPQADPAAADQLIAMLDDAAIQALVEWSFGEGAARDDHAARGRWLATTLGEVAAERALRWIWDDHAPPELLVPSVQVIRGRDGARERAARARLLEHRAGRIPEVVLRWYAETGIPDADLSAVLARLDDHRPRVRAAARDALATHAPDATTEWFRARLTPARIEAMDPRAARDLCVSFAVIQRGRALRPLQGLLDHKVGLFAGKGKGQVLEAAAFGLAALGTADARRLLEEGAKSWVGVRAQACKAALAGTAAGGDR